jgi:hypothetical protein
MGRHSGKLRNDFLNDNPKRSHIVPTYCDWYGGLYGILIIPTCTVLFREYTIKIASYKINGITLIRVKYKLHFQSEIPSHQIASCDSPSK